MWKTAAEPVGEEGIDDDDPVATGHVGNPGKLVEHDDEAWRCAVRTSAASSERTVISTTDAPCSAQRWRDPSGVG